MFEGAMTCRVQTLEYAMKKMRPSIVSSTHRTRTSTVQSSRPTNHMVSTMKVLIFFSSLALVSSALIPVAFTALEASTTQKVVILHDPNVQMSMKQLDMMKAIDDSGVYGTEYEYVVCDVTLPENIEAIQGVGFKDFPLIFTQTNEGGIAPFKGGLNTESFAEFHTFRTLEITDNNVQRMQDSDGLGDVEGMTDLLVLASERPVLVKMYEVCPLRIITPTYIPQLFACKYQTLH
jgi:hypothetical protein